MWQELYALEALREDMLSLRSKAAGAHLAMAARLIGAAAEEVGEVIERTRTDAERARPVLRVVGDEDSP